MTGLLVRAALDEQLQRIAAAREAEAKPGKRCPFCPALLARHPHAGRPRKQCGARACSLKLRQQRRQQRRRGAR